MKTCPFCGSDAMVMPQSHIENDHRALQWVVICQNEEAECNARIPYCNSEKEAVDQWNRREVSDDESR